MHISREFMERYSPFMYFALTFIFYTHVFSCTFYLFYDCQEYHVQISYAIYLSLIFSSLKMRYANNLLNRTKAQVSDRKVSSRNCVIVKESLKKALWNKKELSNSGSNFFP